MDKNQQMPLNSSVTSKGPLYNNTALPMSHLLLQQKEGHTVKSGISIRADQIQGAYGTTLTMI